MHLSSWVSLFSDLGAMAFVLYLSHRMTTHTIPRLAEQYSESSRAQRDDFREALAQQRCDFERWQQREVDASAKQFASVAEGLKDIAREVRGSK